MADWKEVEKRIIAIGSWEVGLWGVGQFSPRLPMAPVPDVASPQG